jgi:predicted phage terminase large subunit-like protein
MTVWGVYTEDPVSAEAMKKPLKYKDMFQKERGYKAPHPKVMLVYAWQERLTLGNSVTKVAETVKRFKVDTILIENKAAGIPVAQELRRLYANLGFQVILDDPKSLDKTSRLYSIQHIFSEGIVYSPDKSWADQVITQVASFPKGKHDDLVDTVSMALRYLRRTGMIARPEEAQNNYETDMQHRGAPPAPLYAV